MLFYIDSFHTICVLLNNEDIIFLHILSLELKKKCHEFLYT